MAAGKSWKTAPLERLGTLSRKVDGKQVGFLAKAGSWYAIKGHPWGSTYAKSWDQAMDILKAYRLDYEPYKP